MIRAPLYLFREIKKDIRLWLKLAQRRVLEPKKVLIEDSMPPFGLSPCSSITSLSMVIKAESMAHEGVLSFAGSSDDGYGGGEER